MSSRSSVGSLPSPDTVVATVSQTSIIPPGQVQSDERPFMGGFTSPGFWNGAVVAVKKLPDNRLSQAIVDVVERAQTLQHRYVRPFLGVCPVVSGSTCIIMPFFKQGNLSQYLIAQPDASVTRLLHGVASGMDYLHSLNITHGRLNPSNILISDDNDACVADYDLYRIIKSDSPAAYLSPEAWKGKVSKPSDVYAFSMVAFEAYTRGPPWGFLSDNQIYHLVVKEDDRPDRPNVMDEHPLSDHEWNLIHASWNTDPNARLTFRQIISLLFQSMSRGDPSARQSPKPDQSQTVSPNTVSSRFMPTSTLQPSIRQIATPAPPYSDGGHRQEGASRMVSPSPVTALSLHAAGTMMGSLRFETPMRSPPQSPAPDSLRPRALSASSNASSVASSMPTSPTSWVTFSSTPRQDPYLTEASSTYSGPSNNHPRQSVITQSSTPFDAASIASPMSDRRGQGRRSSAMSSESGEGWNGWPIAPTPIRYIHRPPSSSGVVSAATPSIQRSASDQEARDRLSVKSARPSAVLIVGALHSEMQEGRDQDLINNYLRMILELIVQSESDIQKLITAGLVHNLISLLKARAVGGQGVNIVLRTLGGLAHDSLSANTIFRTNTATTLLEIIDTSNNQDAMALAIWCLCRIIRSAEIATDLVRQDAIGLLRRKALGPSVPPSTNRIALWCLGNLIYTDALADIFIAQPGALKDSAEHLRSTLSNQMASTADIGAAIFPIARVSRSVKIAKLLHKFGCVQPMVSCLEKSEDPQVLKWSARAVGCMMRPNCAEMAKVLLDAGAAKGLARLPRVIPPESMQPLESFAFCVARFSCAEWGSSTRKQLVEAGVVDSLLAALRTAADVPYPQVHIELALAVSFLGDVGGGDIRKEIVRAGGIEILKRVGATGSPKVSKTCQMAVTSITGNLWTRNAASAKTAMSHDWSGGCPEYQPACPVAPDV